MKLNVTNYNSKPEMRMDGATAEIDSAESNDGIHD